MAGNPNCRPSLRKKQTVLSTGPTSTRSKESPVAGRASDTQLQCTQAEGRSE